MKNSRPFNSFISLFFAFCMVFTAMLHAEVNRVLYSEVITEHGLNHQKVKKEAKEAPRRISHQKFLSCLLDDRFQSMLELATAPESEIKTHLARWPRTKNASPEQKERIEKRALQFREKLRSEALTAAKEMKLSFSGEKESAFIRDYWQKRVEIEKTLCAEVEPKRQYCIEELHQELKQKFSAQK